MECAYCVAIMLICLNVPFIFVIGSLSVDSSVFIADRLCIHEHLRLASLKENETQKT
jgi:hypothetical protein